ncbi:G-protein coupled receptor dmsr-1-like [Haliotis cracherodii]|uniref:G-protein coupled receptor dmsr-1-like n=1 Tax=Haliotis cracherodii TaxID=6455 RepID=UPI0039E85A53
MAANSIGYQNGHLPMVNGSDILKPSAVIDMTEAVKQMLTATTPSPIEKFGTTYGRIHGYLSIAVCIFGIISNALNIIVLTRKHMLSPTNYILTALAIADMLTMSTYPIMATYLYIISQPNCDEVKHPKEWMYFILFHNLFIVTCHNMAMWLTVALAVFRYIFVCIPSKAMTLCSAQRAKLTVGLIVIVTIIVCCPNYVIYRVVDIGTTYHNSTTCYWILETDFAHKHVWYTSFVKWVYGVVIKILPCILLVFLSTLLILAMQRAKRRRARLLGKVSRASDHDHQSNEHNRTTAMLVAVVMFFVITELPQGILALIGSMSSDLWEVYIILGDLMDILVLINSAVNFILYCIMSQQFRNTFKNLFIGKNKTFFSKYHKQNGATYSVVKTDTTMV